jgi:hypothetical protein
LLPDGSLLIAGGSLARNDFWQQGRLMICDLAWKRCADNAIHEVRCFMPYYVLKVMISAVMIVAISEIAKRSPGFAALVAALPLTSLLAFVWLHMEGSSPRQIADLSSQIFWLVLPSLLLFLLLPCLIKLGWGFWASLGTSMAATALGYLAMLPLLRRMGIGL